MQGTPIRGGHWVEVDLERPCRISSATIDWETAYASGYVLYGKGGGGGGMKGTGVQLAAGSQASTATSKQHVKHALQVEGGAAGEWVRTVRLEIRKPATRWGVSVWNLSLFGQCES